MSLVRTLIFMGYTLDRHFVVHGRADGTTVLEWLSGPRPTDAQIASATPAAQAAYDAAQAALAAAAVDKADLKAQFQAAVTRLDQIINAASPNNTQLIAAVRDMATIQKRALRALYGVML